MGADKYLSPAGLTETQDRLSCDRPRADQALAKQIMSLEHTH